MRPDPAAEVRLLGAAIQFLTRLPCPSPAYRPDWLPRAAKYFPLVGGLVGGLAAVVDLAAGRIWPQPIPAILAVAVAILATGALHEDGLADTADSLGGRTRAARLAIMKDSRLGSFGVLALILALALRVAALTTLPALAGAFALVAAGAAGRLAAVILMGVASYAGDASTAKIHHAPGDRPRPGEIALAALFGLAPLLAFPSGESLPALGLAAGLSAFVALRTCRVLGGYTGDVLGAVVALAETGILLGLAAGVRP